MAVAHGARTSKLRAFVVRRPWRHGGCWFPRRPTSIPLEGGEVAMKLSLSSPVLVRFLTLSALGAVSCTVGNIGDDALGDDAHARDVCAARLAEFELLRDTTAESIRWGGQKPGAGYRIEESRTTRFNPLVLRKMYLSLFMFSGEYAIDALAFEQEIEGAR
jgi:hypothetical protein